MLKSCSKCWAFVWHRCQLQYASNGAIMHVPPEQRRRSALWIQRERERARAWERDRGVAKHWSFREFEKKDTEEKYPQCFEVTPTSCSKTPASWPVAQPYWHLISSAGVWAHGNTTNDRLFVWDCICPTSTPLFLLPFSAFTLHSALHPNTQTHTHTHLPLGFFLTALWQFPLLALKRFEIAFSLEALAISN